MGLGLKGLGFLSSFWDLQGIGRAPKCRTQMRHPAKLASDWADPSGEFSSPKPQPSAIIKILRVGG